MFLLRLIILKLKYSANKFTQDKPIKNHSIGAKMKKNHVSQNLFFFVSKLFCSLINKNKQEMKEILDIKIKIE